MHSQIIPNSFWSFGFTYPFCSGVRRSFPLGDSPFRWRAAGCRWEQCGKDWQRECGARRRPKPGVLADSPPPAWPPSTADHLKKAKILLFTDLIAYKKCTHHIWTAVHRPFAYPCRSGPQCATLGRHHIVSNGHWQEFPPPSWADPIP